MRGTVMGAPTPLRFEGKPGELREVGHDGDGGALYMDETGEIWNAGDDHECGAL